MNEDIVVLELADLIYYDKTMRNIIVDKSVFDCFEENSYIEIKFADDDYDLLYTYTMVSEDDNGIYMKIME